MPLFALPAPKLGTRFYDGKNRKLVYILTELKDNRVHGQAADGAATQHKTWKIEEWEQMTGLTIGQDLLDTMTVTPPPPPKAKAAKPAKEKKAGKTDKTKATRPAKPSKHEKQNQELAATHAKLAPAAQAPTAVTTVTPAATTDSTFDPRSLGSDRAAKVPVLTPTTPAPTAIDDILKRDPDASTLTAKMLIAPPAPTPTPARLEVSQMSKAQIEAELQEYSAAGWQLVTRTEYGSTLLRMVHEQDRIATSEACRPANLLRLLRGTLYKNNANFVAWQAQTGQQPAPDAAATPEPPAPPEPAAPSATQADLAQQRQAAFGTWGWEQEYSDHFLQLIAKTDAQGRPIPILFACAPDILPSIHAWRPEDGNERHAGFGCFIVENNDFQAVFDAGGAMRQHGTDQLHHRRCPQRANAQLVQRRDRTPQSAQTESTSRAL